MCQRFICFSLIYLMCGAAGAQTKPNIDGGWSLEQCVQYALSHNISIRQDSLNARLARYTLLQSQLSQLPVVTANGGYGRSFGRSIDPTTNEFIDANYNFLSASGSGNVLLFGWKTVRNSITRNRYSLEASMADLDQLKDDVSLNIANGFLSALLAKEQVEISKNQVGLSQAQLDQTRIFADAGRLPELNVAQLESQVASDSSNLINAIVNYNSSLLDLKTLLNLEFSEPFGIMAPEVEVSNELEVSQMQPEEIYKTARAHFGSVKGSELRVSSAEKNVAVAKGNLYPQLSFNYQIGTNWSSNFYSYQSTGKLLGYSPIGFVPRTGDTVVQPVYQVSEPVVPFGSQLNDNLRQTAMLNLNVPLFNGWQTQYSVRQAKINLATQQLNEYNAELTLKQNVYKAHNNALGSIQKYNAARRAEEAARRALDFAKKRYDLGLTSTVDLLVTENSAFSATANLISAKYDLIFKLKVIDYYLGKEIKL